MDVRGGKASASAGDSDGEEKSAEEGIQFLSDVNVRGDAWNVANMRLK